MDDLETSGYGCADDEDDDSLNTCRAIEAVGIAFSVLIIIVSFMIIYLIVRFGIWPL